MAFLQSKKTIAVCQMTAKSDKKINIDTCSELIKTAKMQNAEVSMLQNSDKTREYLKDKINELEANSKNKNIRETNELKKGYQPKLTS
jgi:hypothetical protein